MKPVSEQIPCELCGGPKQEASRQYCDECADQLIRIVARKMFFAPTFVFTRSGRLLKCPFPPVNAARN